MIKSLDVIAIGSFDISVIWTCENGVVACSDGRGVETFDGRQYYSVAEWEDFLCEKMKGSPSTRVMCSGRGVRSLL